MRYARTNFRLATAALLVALISSCSNDTNDPPGAEGSSAPNAPAATSVTPTSPSPSEPPPETQMAAEAASKVLRQYFATIDRLRRQPTRSISELEAVAISTQLAAQQRLIQSQRSNGLRQTGSTTITALTVQSVNLDTGDPAAGKVPTVQIDVCYNVSAVDILDEDGESVVGPDRPETGWVRYSVSNYRLKAKPTDGWRVASGADLEKAPCVAS